MVEREYAQLHLDSTVASLTSVPVLEGGVLKYGRGSDKILVSASVQIPSEEEGRRGHYLPDDGRSNYAPLEEDAVRRDRSNFYSDPVPD